MCCFNNQNCCRCNCCCSCCRPIVITRTRYIDRTIFPTPTPTPIPPINTNVVAEFLGGTATNTPIVLTNGARYPLTETDIVLNTTANNVVLTAGTYLIRYGSAATSTSTDVPTLGLSINGVQNPATLRSGAANTTSTIAGETLVTVPAGTTITLDSAQDADVTYANNYLIVEKVA